MFQKMFSSFHLGGSVVKNRLAASAMFEYGADSGKITDKIKKRYHQLVHGGAGMVITGMTAVSTGAGVAPIMVNTDYDGYVSDLGEIAADARSAGAKLIVQLQHCGAETFPAEGYDHFAVCEKKVSCLRAYHEATPAELRKTAQAFAASAARVKQAGADGVQIHAAHGFLINTFLSPSTNHRTDEYGGSAGNRARLLFEIYDAVRKAVGKDFIVGVKFPFNDLNENSITERDSLFICGELEKRGIDFIEVSSGMVMDSSAASFAPLVRTDRQAPFLRYAALLAGHIQTPVISVCGYRTPEFIEKALTATSIAAVSLGRPLVREPDLPNRWCRDPSPAKCISCNMCCQSFADGIITCQVKKKTEGKALTAAKA